MARAGRKNISAVPEHAGAIDASPTTEPTTRERILINAAEIFSRQGFANATIRQVAARSGIPVSTLSHHFATWDDLILALLRRGASIQLDVISAIDVVAGRTPSAVFELMIREHLAALLQSPPFLDAFVQFSPEIDQTMRGQVDEAMVRHRLFVFHIVRAAASRRRFDDAASEIIMRIIIGGIYAARHWQKPILRTLFIDNVSVLVTEIVLCGLGEWDRPNEPLERRWGSDPLPRPCRGKGSSVDARTVDRIYANAAALLAELGPSGLSMRALATRCGIRAPTIYYYCASREKLLVEVASRTVSELIDSLNAIARRPGISPMRRLRWSVSAYLHRLFSNATGLAAFARVFRDPPPSIEQPIQALADRISAAFVDMLGFSKDSARNELAVQLLIGSMDYSVLWFGGRRAFDYSLDALAELFVETISVGISSDREKHLPQRPK